MSDSIIMVILLYILTYTNKNSDALLNPESLETLSEEREAAWTMSMVLSESGKAELKFIMVEVLTEVQCGH